MKKFFLLLFVALSFYSLMAFSQWTDTIQKKIFSSFNVFVIPGDKVYHKDTCKLLTGGRTGMPQELAQARGYKPCLECFPEATAINYEWTFSLQGPSRSNVPVYSDNFIDIAFLINKTQIGFVIQNKTDSGIKINWDEISFISSMGRASRIIHSGIRLMDRNIPQAPTVIPPRAKITDIAIPSENINFINGWQEERLFSGDYMSYNGKEFSLYFPIEMKGVKKEYSFKFKINVTKVSAENK